MLMHKVVTLIIAKLISTYALRSNLSYIGIT